MSGIVNTTGAVSGIIGTTVGTPAGGLSHVSQWQITTSTVNSINPITAWQATGVSGAGTIGDAMTVNTGIFTFPATGIWYIQGQINVRASNVESHYNYMFMGVTLNNASSWTDVIYGYCSMENVSDLNEMGRIYYVLDVTDTSNVKCRFGAGFASTSAGFHATASTQQSGASFMRLGDT